MCEGRQKPQLRYFSLLVVDVLVVVTFPAPLAVHVDKTGVRVF